MRTASPALLDYINQVRAQPDASLFMADCYTFTLADGTQLFYTNVDVPVTLDGNTFVANSLLVDGLKYKCSVGLDVDKQTITIVAKPTDLIDGVPALAQIQRGILDGATIRRDRVFLPSWPQPNQPTPAPIGAILLFLGPVGEIKSVGRTTAQVEVNSGTVLLDLNMPRNIYSPACNWVLYGFGCNNGGRVVESNFTASGTVEAGANSTSQIVVPPAFGSPNFAQGKITFTSGVNEGLSATIKNGAISNGAPMLFVTYPLPNVPNVGDTFTASFGCDHTQATCQARFDNLINFRGFPFVPPPTFAA